MLVKIFVVVTALLVAACSNNPYEIELMSVPGILGVGELDANAIYRDAPMTEGHDLAVFYATDRLPSDDLDESPFYENERGHRLRLGVASVAMAREGTSWEQVREASLLKSNTERFPLKVSAVKEFGPLLSAVESIQPLEESDDELQRNGRAFAEAINTQLARSPVKDIYIYVHGYKVVFDNPVLVASELWHFLGYRGVFLAYAWPSTPSLLAYASDLESASYSSNHLRKMLRFLADETEAENIHLVAYSAGSRVVLASLHQLALLEQDSSDQSIEERYRLGETVLLGSDYDRDLFGVAVNDGLLRMQQRLSVYISPGDKALDFSRRVFRRERLGQLLAEQSLDADKIDAIGGGHQLDIIDVGDAEGSRSGNGHAYFRRSPWVSSDLLLMLRYGLNADKRGLYRRQGEGLWRFPSTYGEEGLLEVRDWIFRNYHSETPLPDSEPQPESEQSLAPVDLQGLE